MPYERAKPIDLLDRDDLDALLAACTASTTGLRNRALLSLLYFSGLRTHEALTLTTRDVLRDTDGAIRLNVRRGKGGKQRVATLAPPATADLERWLERRSRVVGSSGGPLFCTHSDRGNGVGAALDAGYVRAMVARLARRARIDKRVHPHAFRHAHASYLHHRGVPVAAIQVQLGHSSPLTTTRYLASIGAHDAHVEVLRAFG